jgi:hypothetical protein
VIGDPVAKLCASVAVEAFCHGLLLVPGTVFLSFLHALSPAFIIELRSKSDGLNKTFDRVEVWLANGVQLGWLVDPYTR